MEKRCQETCGNGNAERCVPFFDVQNTMMHYNWANRRMLIALISICVTMILVVVIFATNQTKREQMWQETIKSIVQQTTTAEVDHGKQDTDP